MKKFIFYIIIILTVGFLLRGYIRQQSVVKPKISEQVVSSPQEESVIKAVFNCADGKSIQTEFSKEQVKLTLSDGRTWVLPSAISGSGARYANADETQVFWNKGNTAFIEENGQTTFQDCVTNTN